MWFSEDNDIKRHKEMKVGTPDFLLHIED